MPPVDRGFKYWRRTHVTRVSLSKSGFISIRLWRRAARCEQFRMDPACHGSFNHVRALHEGRGRDIISKCLASLTSERICSDKKNTSNATAGSYLPTKWLWCNKILCEMHGVDFTRFAATVCIKKGRISWNNSTRGGRRTSVRVVTDTMNTMVSTRTAYSFIFE